jgi:hypothetical protein
MTRNSDGISCLNTKDKELFSIEGKKCLVLTEIVTGKSIPTQTAQNQKENNTYMPLAWLSESI